MFPAGSWVSGSLVPLLLCLFAPAPFPRQTTAYLGIEFTPGNRDLRLVSVFAASPAQRAGLRMNDEIIAVDGKKLAGPDDLAALLRRKKPGNAVALLLRRNNAEVNVRLTLAARRVTPYLGVSVLMQDEPIINLVANRSPASEAGLQVNDVLLTVDDVRFSNTNELASLLAKKEPGDVVTVAIRRNNENLKIKVKLGTRPGM